MIPFHVVNKYINLFNLKRLEKKGDKWNAECPICKEGKSAGRKKRFWVLRDNTKTTLYCFNCGFNTSFESFIYTHYNHLYIPFKKDCISDNLIYEPPKEENKEIDTDIMTKFIPLKKSREGLLYFKKRKLPKSLVEKSYYTDNFIKIVSDYKLSNFKYIPKQDKRIVFPVYNNKKLKYIQGRTITNSKIRYMNVQVNDGKKIWNYDDIDWSKKVLLFEGIFDACYFDNSGAILTSSINIDKSNAVVVLDNDIHTEYTIKKKALNMANKGYKLAIMPSYIKEKDINEMIMNGWKKDDILDLINKNTYSGMSAKLKLKVM